MALTPEGRLGWEEESEGEIMKGGREVDSEGGVKELIISSITVSISETFGVSFDDCFISQI